MPNYDYICSNCDHKLTNFQRMTDRNIRKCPKCNEKTLVRQIGSGSAVIFKGAGFYENDYPRTGGRQS